MCLCLSIVQIIVHPLFLYLIAAVHVLDLRTSCSAEHSNNKKTLCRAKGEFSLPIIAVAPFPLAAPKSLESVETFKVCNDKLDD